MAVKDGLQLLATECKRHPGSKFPSGNLILAKTGPELRTKVSVVATNAHVSILGHVTRDDVLTYLNATDTANGFANRFIWLCVSRSKFLPHGGSLHSTQLEPYRRRLEGAVQFASQEIRLRRNPDADLLWEQAYGELSKETPGLLGSVVSRGEAQVLRLSCLYALLDEKDIITPDHLHAAIALWDYSERSAAFIFGRSIGKPDHEKLLAALRQSPDGLTLTEISVGVFAKHKNTEQIQRILTDLQRWGMARRDVGTSGGTGRPPERWYATDGHFATMAGDEAG